MRFQDLPQLTQSGSYRVNVTLTRIIPTLAEWERDYGLILDPDFQRAHVWTEQQQIKFVEFMLRGGKSGRELLFNCPRFGSNSNNKEPMVLVDGKQRINAITRFMSHELPIFGGHYLSDFTDTPRYYVTDFILCINDLQTRAEVLQWYLEVNSGTPHTEQELERVRLLLESER